MRRWIRDRGPLDSTRFRAQDAISRMSWSKSARPDRLIAQGPVTYSHCGAAALRSGGMEAMRNLREWWFAHKSALSSTSGDPATQTRPRPFQSLLIGVGVLLALVSQVWLYVTPADPAVAIPGAIWLTLLGAALFAIAPFLPSRLVDPRIPLPVSRCGAWVLAATLLSCTAAGAAIAFEQHSIKQYLPIVSLWLLGASCYVIGFLPQRVQWPDWRAATRSRWLEGLGLALLGAFGVALRFYQLGSQPVVINGDEGLIGMFAQSTSAGSLANPFGLWENIGTLYLQLINVALRVFGPSVLSLRLLPAIGGSLAVLTTYLLARQLGGQRVAFLASGLLAMSHIHVHFSRTVAVTYIQGTWLVPLEFYLLLAGMQSRRMWLAALGGVLLAIHMNVYITAQIAVGILAVFTVVVAIWLRAQFVTSWRQLAVFWGGFVVAVIPQASYMLRRPEEFLSRLNADGTFNSGWLANEIASTGKSVIQILLERVSHAFLSLIYYPAIDFYGSPVPVLSFVAAVLFVLGLAYALLHVHSLSGLLLNGYFWGMTVAVGIFAIPPSADSYRMIIALPAAMILAAFGLDQLLATLGLGWTQDRFRYGAITALTLTGLAVFNIWTYFFDFIGQCRYGGDPQTRFASYLGTTVRELDSEGAVYLLSDGTFFYGSHASVDFLSQGRAIMNVADPLTGQDVISGETVIASPGRVEELLSWARGRPGGQLHYQRDCGSVILLAYQVP